MESKPMSIGDTVFGLTHFDHLVVGTLVSFECNGLVKVMSDDLYACKSVTLVDNIIAAAKAHAERVRKSTPFLD